MRSVASRLQAPRLRANARSRTPRRLRQLLRSSGRGSGRLRRCRARVLRYRSAHRACPAEAVGGLRVHLARRTAPSMSPRFRLTRRRRVPDLGFDLALFGGGRCWLRGCGRGWLRGCVVRRIVARPARASQERRHENEHERPGQQRTCAKGLRHASKGSSVLRNDDDRRVREVRAPAEGFRSHTRPLPR